MHAFRAFLVRVGNRFGRAAWMFYALLFLLTMTGALVLVYLVFGYLMLKSPPAVLILTAILVLIIVVNGLKRKS